MKKIGYYVGFFVASLATLFILGYFISKSSIFHLKKVRYEVVQTSPYFELQKKSLKQEVDSYIGRPLWEIDIFKIEKSLKEQPWIENITLSKIYPDELIIKIEPRKILANIRKSPSQVQPVAEDNTLLSSTAITLSPVAPLLSHRSFLTDERLRESAILFLKDLPVEGNFSLQNVSEIVPVWKTKNHTSDIFRVFLKSTKTEVLIDTENVFLKAQRVSRVIDYLEEHKMEDRIIDANFSKKVLVRPRNRR